MIVLYLLIALAIGFAAGAFVWRKNAKKFDALEAKAKAKGKSLLDFIT